MAACEFSLFSREIIRDRKIDVLLSRTQFAEHESIFLDPTTAFLAPSADFIGLNVADVSGHVVRADNPSIELYGMKDLSNLSRQSDSLSFSTTLSVGQVLIELAAFLTADGVRNEAGSGPGQADRAITGIWGRGGLSGAGATTISASTTSIDLTVKDLTTLGLAPDVRVRFCHNLGTSSANGSAFSTGIYGTHTCVDAFGSGTSEFTSGYARMEIADVYYPWKSLSAGGADFEKVFLIAPALVPQGPGIYPALSGTAPSISQACRISIPSTYNGMPSGHDTVFLFVKECAGSGLTLPTANMKIWLKAGTGWTINGGTREWQDQSGNGSHATVATGTSEPVLSSSNGPNSTPAVEFDGSNDYLSFATSAFSFTSNATIILVVRYDTQNPIQYGISGNASPSDYLTFLLNASGFVYQWRTGATSVESGSNFTSWHAHILKITSGAAVAYHDSSSTQVDSFAASGATNPIMSFYLGRYGSSYLDGAIAEVVFYNAALSTADLTLVRSYIASKYGL